MGHNPHVTVCRKVCSQNRPNNAFPCVTPLLVNKKHTCLTIIKSASKTTKASISQQQCTCAGFFQSDESEDKVELLLRDVTLLAFSCLSFTAMRCLPFLLHCVDKFLWYLRAFFPRKWSSVLGSPSLLHPNAFFCLRGACAQLAREMQLNFSVLELLDWHILKPLLLENKQQIQRKTLMIKSIYTQCMRVYIYIICIWYNLYIYHDSTWKHLRQPCANLAPSLCFGGFPCVTPHNENVKSYKSVGCVPPRLKFLFRTFDRLSCVIIYSNYKGSWNIPGHQGPLESVWKFAFNLSQDSALHVRFDCLETSFVFCLMKAHHSLDAWWI